MLPCIYLRRDDAVVVLSHLVCSVIYFIYVPTTLKNMIKLKNIYTTEFLLKTGKKAEIPVMVTWYVED